MAVSTGIRAVHTDTAPAHVGPVPQAVVAGGWIFVSALFGTDPATGQRPDEAADEADLLLKNLGAVLAAAGAGLSDVVRAGIFMTDLAGDRPAFNAAWVRHFGAHRPARSAVGVNDFGRAGEHVRFMVEVIALHPDRPAA